MDNLLCDESWLSDPLTPEPEPNFCLNIHDDHVVMSPGIDAARVEEAISIDLEKESCFSNHGHKFVEFLASKKLIDARFRTVQWLIQTRSRLNLSFETLFSAANCFDRFVNVISCDEWSKWMVELVAVTSLSVASKFNDVASPSPQELQMEGLTHMFHHKTVLEMELILLKALDWRVNSVTSLSFSQILMTKMGIAGGDIMMNRITEHLLDDLCDLKMLGYAPSVVAVAAMWTVLEEKAALEDNFGKIMNLFGQEHKEKIAKCIHVMKSRNVEKGWGRKVSEVKSLVSVLQRGDIMNMNDVYYGGDLSTIFQILRSEGINKKRDRDFYEDKLRPAKRMTFKNMSSSPLASSLFPSPLSTLSAHKHGRSRNFCVSRKEQCLRVRATRLPEGMIVPKVQPKSQPAFLGFTQTAEIWNSRACMIGLIGTFIVELILNKGILELIGVEIGKGLDLPL
ncbi:hypothetical protein HID58_008117 [Brassica napus]|uniref:Cyclin-like domain-containing protein n=1 Tax=Brassica napus TaxID=3708 RepID=A0ABQ8DR59_BRANA|nr:hypothetical protein HID58_008117 [Brassica napus]